MEVAETFGTNFATKDVGSLQGCVYEILILSWRRQYIWFATANFSYFYFLIFIVSCNIGRLQWICQARGFEINVSNISVVHLTKYLGGGSLSWSWRMSLLGLRALDVCYFHNVPSRIVELLLFEWTSAWNVINV